jgi:hypothetical protein
VGEWPMRIIPDNAHVGQRVPGTKSELVVNYFDTIEITDDELNLIEKGFDDEAMVSETYQYCFSRYLRELIKLRGCK